MIGVNDAPSFQHLGKYLGKQRALKSKALSGGVYNNPVFLCYTMIAHVEKIDISAAKIVTALRSSPFDTVNNKIQRGGHTIIVLSLCDPHGL